MHKMFLLEVVDHKTGQVIGSMRGTAYILSTQLQTVLEDLKDGQGVTITEDDA